MIGLASHFRHKTNTGSQTRFNAFFFQRFQHFRQAGKVFQRGMEIDLRRRVGVRIRSLPPNRLVKWIEVRTCINQDEIVVISHTIDNYFAKHFVLVYARQVLANQLLPCAGYKPSSIEAGITSTRNDGWPYHFVTQGFSIDIV
uniref:Uncharacterized protein n=1 Tax=Klebsiella pneumoniae TaxID=573 RepID=A0A2P1BPH0_KLEPN|nr:hypothetical protein [Klebsiella pneumoniae]